MQAIPSRPAARRISLRLRSRPMAIAVVLLLAMVATAGFLTVRQRTTERRQTAVSQQWTLFERAAAKLDRPGMIAALDRIDSLAPGDNLVAHRRQSLSMREADPHDVIMLHFWMNQHLKDDQLDLAAREAEKRLAMVDNDALAHRILAHYCLKQNDSEKAIAHLQALPSPLAEHPPGPSALLHTLYLYHRLGLDETTLRFYRATRLIPILESPETVELDAWSSVQLLQCFLDAFADLDTYPELLRYWIPAARLAQHIIDDPNANPEALIRLTQLQDRQLDLVAQLRGQDRITNEQEKSITGELHERRTALANRMVAEGIDQPKETVVEPEEVTKARKLFEKGEFDSAYRELLRAVKDDPKLPPARLMMARMFLAANEGQAFRQTLELATTENPKHPEIYLTHASFALAEGRLTDAILHCGTVLQLADAEGFSAAQRKTYRIEAHSGLAAAYDARADWASARKHLASWLSLDSDSAVARQRMGRVLFHLELPDEALTELRKACKLDPKLEPAELTMALLFVGTADAKRAEEWFAAAIREHPQTAKVHQAYGGWLLDVGKLEAAAKPIETAIRLEPQSRDTLALRGLQARYEKDYSAAEKQFEQVLRDAPADFFASNQLALVLIEQPGAAQQRRALQLAEVNARQYRQSVEAMATLGWVYLRLGRIDDAERPLAQATSNRTISADVAYYLAHLHVARKRWDDASAILEKAVSGTGVFVNRKNAIALLSEVKGKLPKKEPPK